MTVLHVISGELDKGAARGALWLHKELRSQGINSILFHTGGKHWDDDELAITSSGFFLSKFLVKLVLRLWRNLLTMLYRDSTKELFSSGQGIISLHDLEERYRPDIIHLHWINHFSVRYSSIAHVQVPVFWTLRDMWPFTGGCHYAVGCRSFVDECGACPLLGSTRNKDLSRLIFNHKKRTKPVNVHYVGISRWILREFQQSKFASSKVSHVPNGIQTKEWFPVKESTDILTFAKGRKVILIGAVNLNAAYKGGKFIQDLASKLSATKYCIVAFGRVNSLFTKNLKLDVLSLGVIKDHAYLRTVYSTSDVYFFPSVLEAFGKTVVESILCGTPVVCFGNSGPGEIVEHEKTGYICDMLNTSDMVDGVASASTLKIPAASRMNIARRYSVEHTAKEMITLYKQAK
tara:strand:+ start:313 stop:1524 length:1212 start_codon:yes stop_codon:yes gene_type:complete